MDRYKRKSSSRGGRSGGTSGSRDTLLAAVALQDHLARTMRMPGGPKNMPSMEPGSDLTLAQHLGLIPRPPPLLTEAEWDEVHLKSRLRQDSLEECPICREEFRGDPQVLLSCTHVFHRSCLASYERFARCRACPLCRSQQYQRRVINDGAEAYKNSCAKKIQAAVRGWIARRRYRDLRRITAPRDPRLRMLWMAERLEEEGDRMLQEIEDDREDIDALFAELDANLEESRKVCDKVDRPLARQFREKLEAREEAESGMSSAHRTGGRQQPSLWHGEDDDSHRESSSEEGSHDEDEDDEPSAGRGAGPGMLLDVDLYGGASLGRVVPRQAFSDGASTSDQTSVSMLTAEKDPRQSSGRGRDEGGAQAGPSSIKQAEAESINWPEVVQKAKGRGEKDCPICIGALGRRGKMGVAWLSCTHCFHLDCIMAFEAFELAHEGKPCCPVCRSAYQRRCFSD